MHPAQETRSAAASDTQQIWAWNRDVPPMVDEPLHQRFTNKALEIPDAPAIDAWDRQFTYAELDAASALLAGRLMEAGVGPEVMVPICFEKSAWAMVAMLAILRAGGAFVPLDPEQPADRRRSIMEQARGPVAVVSAVNLSLMHGDDRKVIVVEPFDPQGCEYGCSALPIVSPGSAAYVLFTSGSTGVPKGVVMEHRAVTSSQIHRARLKGYTQNLRVLQFASYTFDTCIDEIFMTLANGGCVCVPSDYDRINRLASAIQHLSVELLEVTPTVARLISPEQVPSVNTIIFGGEYMSQLDFVPWKDRVRVINTYGPTECCVECVLSDITPETPPGLIGKGAGSALWVVDPDNHDQLVPLGAIGELLVEGPALARGYLNDAQKTAQSFVQDPEWLIRGADGWAGRRGRLYKTGDLVWYDEHGNLFYVGRKDTQVKINGQRLELGEVESHVSRLLPEGAHVIADVISSSGGSKTLVAFIRLPGEGGALLEMMPGAKGLQTRLFQTIPRYMVPTAFFRIRDFPMTLSGKADRRLLFEAAVDLGKETSLEGMLRPTSSIERKLQQIWADVLFLEPARISVKANFFELGGDSIAAIKVAGQARKQDMKLAVVDIFKQPTLCDLAAKVATKNHKKKKVTISPFSLLRDGLLLRDHVAKEYGLHQQIEDLLPCTPLQEGLLSLTSRDSGEYMIQKVLLISDGIDTVKFCAAWEAVVKMLPILRTRMFLAQGYDGILQGVLREQVHWILANDLSQYLESDKAQAMGLGDSLTRYALIDNGRERLMVWTIHHCLYDGWTMPRMLAMVERAYQDLVPVCLGNFGSFVKHFLDRSQKEAKDFWTSYLAEAQITALPKRVLRIETEPARGFIEKTHAALFQNKKGHVPSTVIRAALGIVLGQLTGLDDVVFGTTVSGRQCTLDDIEDIMGPTIATVPFRIQIESEKTIGEFLDTIQNQAIAMTPYEYEGLHNIGQLSRSCQDACNFQTYLVVQQQHDSESFDSGFLGRWQGESGRANGLSTYPLMIECFLQKDEINIQATFDQEVTSPLGMERIMGQFCYILDQLLQTSPSQKLCSINPPSAFDKQQIWTWNATHPEPVKELLHGLFIRKTREMPDALATEAWDGRFTYSELDIASSRLARHLVRAGVKPEDMVPICFEKSKWVLVAMLAVLKSGGAFVPLDPNQPELRREKVTKQARGPVIIASTLHADLVKADGREIIVVGPLLFEDAYLKCETPSELAVSVDVSPECAAYVLFTSGSTGEPKGVVMEHQAVSSSLSLRSEGQGFGPQCRVLQFATYTFDAILDEIFMTLVSGGCVCIPSDEDRMSNLSGAIRDLRVNTIGLTPTVARLIDPKEVPAISLVILWGEAVFRNDLARWSHISRLLITMGPTECCVTCAQYNVDVRNLPHSSLIGKAVGARSWIVHPKNHDELVPVGAVGELLIEGPGLARGYLNDAEKTEAAFIRGPQFLCDGSDTSKVACAKRRLYKTGDLVRYDDTGNLVYVGRNNAQVKLNGQRVELGEIECQLANSVPTASHVIADIAALSGGQRVLAAFIKFKRETAVPADSVTKLRVITDKLEIEKEMTKRLPRHMIPSALFEIEHVPRTLTGKVDRKLLRETVAAFTLRDLNQKPPQGEITRPMTDNEEKLQQIWAETLRLDRSAIPVAGHFFRLGGNSVAAMKVASQARRQAMNITVVDIFSFPRLCDLAAVAKSSESQEDPTIAPFSLLSTTKSHEQICREIAAMHGLEQNAIENLLPCTPLQEGLLSLTSLDGGYIMQRVLRVADDVEMSRLRAAWEVVVDKLPILRTRMFSTQEHQLLQGVLRQEPMWAQASLLDEYLRSDAAQPMGLGDALSRYAIISSESSKERWVVWTIHHSLYDAWVIPRILDMFERAYYGTSLGNPVGFDVFVKYFVKRDHKAAKEFWESYLAGALVPPQPPKQTKSAKRGLLRRDRAITLGHRNHVPSAFIRAAMAITLGQFTSLDDIIFGTTVFGRNCPVEGIENVMGPTIATVPVRIKLQANGTVKHLLNSIQSQAMSVLPYEHEGLQNIQRISQSCRDACQFQIYLVVQQDDSTSLKTGSLGEWQDDEGRDGLYTYPIMMECHVRESTVEVCTSFSTDAISGSEMEQFLDRFHHVLAQLVERSSTTLQDIEALPKSNLQPLCEWSRSGTATGLNNSGALNSKHVLRQTARTSALRKDNDSLLPVIDSERKLRKIWASVLQLEPSTISFTDSFFQLGGDSITAMKLAAAIRIFGWNICVSSILKFPTIAQQVTKISVQQGSELALTIPGPYELISRRQEKEILQHLGSRGLQHEVIDILPATDFQNRIVMDAMPNPEAASNYFSLDLGPCVDFVALQNACNILVDKTEIFRTVFVLSQGRAWQVVLKRLPIELTQLEVQSDSFTELHTKLPSRPCLFDHPTIAFSLALVPAFGYKLIIAISHAQYDGLSIPVILEVLGGAYAKGEVPPCLPFSAYSMLKSNLRSSSVGYWKELLESSRLTQGMSRFSPHVVPANGLRMMEDSRTVDLPSIPEGFTVALLANLAWALLLHNITGEEDISYVTLVAGRSAPIRDIDGIVGPCINLIPVRLDISPRWTVPQLLERLRTQFTSLHQRDTMGIDEIQEQCTDWPSTDIFDSIFFHQNVDERYEHRLTGGPRKVDLYLNPSAPVRRTFVTSYQEGRTLKVKLLTTTYLMTDKGATALLDAFSNAFTVIRADLQKLTPISKHALNT